MTRRWTTEDLASLSPEVRQQVRAQMRNAPRETGAGKKPKYRNEPKWVNGIRFDSKLEAMRYGELLILERESRIFDLKVHEPFALHAPARDGQAIRVGAYVADFVYWRDGKLVVEDTKSVPTRRHPLYRWKCHHFEIEYDIRIIEISRAHRTTGVTA